MARAFSKLMFTPSVQQQQAEMGSRDALEAFVAGDVVQGQMFTDAEAQFIAGRDGFYQASISETGWPYVQFRGGPRGFLKVLDAKTLAYADFRGNRQYISHGNIAAQGRVSLILMDYPNQRRLKIAARAEVADLNADAALKTALTDLAYRARPERAVILSVEGFDWNCPQHIPQRLTLDELDPFVAPLRAERDALRAEVAALKQAMPG